MDGDENDVEGSEHIVRVVKRPVGVDVHFRAREHPDVVKLPVDGLYLFLPLPHLIDAHAPCHSYPGGVVGDGDVLVTQFAGG